MTFGLSQHDFSAGIYLYSVWHTKKKELLWQKWEIVVETFQISDRPRGAKQCNEKKKGSTVLNHSTEFRTHKFPLMMAIKRIWNSIVCNCLTKTITQPALLEGNQFTFSTIFEMWN